MNFKGGEEFLVTREIFAGNGLVHEEILSLMEEHFNTKP
jgi:hypothetical protein